HTVPATYTHANPTAASTAGRSGSPAGSRCALTRVSARSAATRVCSATCNCAKTARTPTDSGGSSISGAAVSGTGVTRSTLVVATRAGIHRTVEGRLHRPVPRNQLHDRFGEGASATSVEGSPSREETSDVLRTARPAHRHVAFRP